MNPAIFSLCEAANICNSPSFSIHVCLATSAVLELVIVFARKMQLSYNTELLLPNMGVLRKSVLKFIKCVKQIKRSS